MRKRGAQYMTSLQKAGLSRFGWIKVNPFVQKSDFTAEPQRAQRKLIFRISKREILKKLIWNEKFDFFWPALSRRGGHVFRGALGVVFGPQN
jgi:hypothetical protein